jgi:hypothetical protein
MPDQYTLSAFQRNELTPGHKPVMAEIDLTSSHIPWAPLPAMVPWNKVGNGSIFDPQLAESESATQVWRSNNTVRQFYGQSIQYTLTALTSWVTELNDPNLVLIVLGDHQPHTSVSGPGGTHDVPISITPAPRRYSSRCPPGAGRTGCCLLPALRSNPWTPSAISSSIPSAANPGSHGERDLGAVTSMTLGWDNPTADPATTIPLADTGVRGD